MIEGSAHVSGDSLYFYVNTHNPTTGAAADVDAAGNPAYRIYTQENGTAVATGSMAKLDDTNTLGFYSEAVDVSAFAPGEYVVYITATVNAIAATKGIVFVVGNHPALVRTKIATLSSQTSFTLTKGPAENNALIGCLCLIRDSASASQFAMAMVSAYVGSTKTVTLDVDPAIFTMAVGDNVEIFPAQSHLRRINDTRVIGNGTTTPWGPG